MAMKGISPMIATVLLLAFTVAVGGVLSIWISGLTTSQTATVENRSSGVMKCSPGLIVKRVDVGNETNITYWNGGQYAISGIRVEVLNASVTKTETPSDTSLESGDMGFHETGGDNIAISRIRVRGTCQGQPVAADCEIGDGCWNAV